MAGEAWDLELAGCPCAIRADNDEWVVVFASSIARSSDLAKAIERASGGLVDAEEAKAVAGRIRPRAA
jgi:hypothetical protein